MAPFAEVKDLVSVIALDVCCRSQAFGFYSCFSTKDDVGDQSTGAAGHSPAQMSVTAIEVKIG